MGLGAGGWGGWNDADGGEGVVGLPAGADDRWAEPFVWRGEWRQVEQLEQVVGWALEEIVDQVR